MTADRVESSHRGQSWRWYLEARCRWEDAEAVGEIFWGNRTVERGPRMLLWKTAIKDWTRSQKRDSCTGRRRISDAGRQG